MDLNSLPQEVVEADAALQKILDEIVAEWEDLPALMAFTILGLMMASSVLSGTLKNVGDDEQAKLSLAETGFHVASLGLVLIEGAREKGILPEVIRKARALRNGIRLIKTMEEIKERLGRG